jgi:L-cysteine/cystine lyase
VLEHGRTGDDHARQLRSVTASLRSRYARVLGCDPDEVALTASTHDGVNTVVRGLHLRRRDELLTSDEEHPSLLVPLAAAARRYGADVRTVPFAELAGAVGPRTRLVACSHVSWVSGKVADVPALAASGAPVLLDGAQALGALAVDVRALGCDYYAASGQKWLCGPQGAGCLYVRRERWRSLAPPWPSLLSLGDARDPAELVFHAEARRFDTAGTSAPLCTWALAALEVLEDAGWDWVLERGPQLASALADRLAEGGLRVAPRGRSTLVCWNADDPEETVGRLAEAGVVVRSIPARGLVRASVGAWNGEADLERLVAGVL